MKNTSSRYLLLIIIFIFFLLFYGAIASLLVLEDRKLIHLPEIIFFGLFLIVCVPWMFAFFTGETGFYCVVFVQWLLTSFVVYLVVYQVILSKFQKGKTKLIGGPPQGS
jgi:hypothetical protein